MKRFSLVAFYTVVFFSMANGLFGEGLAVDYGIPNIKGKQIVHSAINQYSQLFLETRSGVVLWDMERKEVKSSIPFYNPILKERVWYGHDFLPTTKSGSVIVVITIDYKTDMYFEFDFNILAEVAVDKEYAESIIARNPRMVTSRRYGYGTYYSHEIDLLGGFALYVEMITEEQIMERTGKRFEGDGSVYYRMFMRSKTKEYVMGGFGSSELYLTDGAIINIDYHGSFVVVTNAPLLDNGTKGDRTTYSAIIIPITYAGVCSADASFYDPETMKIGAELRKGERVNILRIRTFGDGMYHYVKKEDGTVGWVDSSKVSLY